jgi:hypothetical protein
MHLFRKFISAALIVSTTLLGLPLPASASMISTEEAVAVVPSPAGNRERALALLQRSDIRGALEKWGVSAQEASLRVNAMSEQEVAQLADRLEQAPAGGDVLGILFTLFIILLITDILGFTKVFPFTRAVR